MKKKLDLLIIISIAVLISVAAIVAFNLEFGPTKVAAHLTRLILLGVVSYFLYQEKQWARWTFVVLSLLAGVLGALAVLSLVALEGDDFGLTTVILGAISLFYIASGIYLGFVRKWNK